MINEHGPATPSAQLLALTDQQDAAAKEQAKVLGAYYRGLIENGIPEDMAGFLVHNYAQTYWGSVFHRCCPCGQIGWSEDG